MTTPLLPVKLPLRRVVANLSPQNGIGRRPLRLHFQVMHLPRPELLSRQNRQKENLQTTKWLLCKPVQSLEVSRLDESCWGS